MTNNNIKYFLLFFSSRIRTKCYIDLLTFGCTFIFVATAHLKSSKKIEMLTNWVKIKAINLKEQYTKIFRREFCFSRKALENKNN